MQNSKNVKSSSPEYNLFILYANMDSFLNKRAEFKQRLSDYRRPPDVIAITEVKPKNFRYQIDLCEIQIEGYNMIENNITTNNSRGVVMYVKNEVPMFKKQTKSSDNVLIKLEIQAKHKYMVHS